MNILNTCLFRLTAVWQKNGPRPGKPLRRTIVRDFPDAAGMENNYLHECKLFVPDAPIPDTITALQKTVLAGIRPVKEFYQKKLFFRWLADNKHHRKHFLLFSGTRGHHDNGQLPQ
ncbi:MAG: hypothetical protein J0651_03450 [Actinobacteria bacterium]|nr:hypothetical protein [Actinomycetota bacterium]